ncbi:hypothetical protein DOTSEDRAFT_67537 [Dothistroma septosporum NZE10]|uniref:Uncharacterized protein n=1 Tax=Dothistroma septosporum (strain NZE10 / CBS 128990) TaxID=675120 RepID=N1Q209_DOTSN|nr:hypothetical protein DOTSEDRAFT_67537 [Dothistroma septosporum NZE10]
MAAMHNGGAWSYAVPLDEMDGNVRHIPHHCRDTTGNANAENEGKKLLEKRPSAWDLMSDSETTKQRRTSMRQNNTTAAGRKRSRNQLREMRQPQDEDKNAKVPGVDDSAWIHRDKLAQIEIQEMAEAGIHVRRSRRSESAGPNDSRNGRSVSRSSTHRARSRTSQTHQNDISNDVDYASAYPAYDESPRKRISPVPSAADEEPAPQPVRREQHPAAYADYNPYGDTDFHSLEEVARERQAYQQQVTRPSTSRIPVSRVTPVPLPKDIAERDSPLPRSRAGSQNWGASFDEMRSTRKIRSPSVSSAILLDSDLEKSEQSKRTPPGSSSNKNSSNDEYSPPKSRVPTKATPGSRKASAPVASTIRPGSSHRNNQRAVSGAATAPRPGSSSGRGHKSRPSTGRHSPPEGEAPWIASMYKPDPRLPPEEQMLPTHAKRMMQQQWEREGKSGTVYDRDLNLLNDEEPQRPTVPVLNTNALLQPIPRSPSPQKHRVSPNGSAHAGPWPLSPAKSDTRSETGSIRPGTSGGYKITPTIPSSQQIQRSTATSPISAVPPLVATHNTMPRVPDLDEKEEAKPKKACCCVVM